MGKIFTVTNMKGGCGKTTLTVNLAAGLAKRGKKILVVDQCPQGNATEILLSEDIKFEHSTRDLYYGTPLKLCIYKSKVNGIDIVPSNMELVSINEDIKNEPDRNIRLRKALNAQAIDNYDYVLIDTSSLLGTLVVNTLYAVDRLIIPIDTIFALRGFGEYHGVISDIAKIEGCLAIDSIVLTMVKQNSTHFKHLREALDEVHIDNVCKTVIPHSIKFPDAQANNETIYDFAPGSHPAIQYMKLVDELLERWEREAEMELSKKNEQITEDEEKVDFPTRSQSKRRKESLVHIGATIPEEDMRNIGTVMKMLGTTNKSKAVRHMLEEYWASNGEEVKKQARKKSRHGMQKERLPVGTGFSS